MKKYFVNPELRVSSAAVLFTVSLFFTITAISFKLYHDSLKKDYINTMGAITSRLIEKNPELESDIVPLITRKISDKESEKGQAILKQYGLTEDLENQLFPYVNSTFAKDDFTVIVIFICMALTLLVLNYYQCGFFYNKIRNLTAAAKKVIEGEYDINLNENKEGDLSKLAVSFNSMKEIIRNNLSELRKEKEFLVNLLSDISHQLKTPLTSMIVYNDIMLNKELSKEQRITFLSSSQNQLNRMKWLIQNMLKLAKLDAKAIEFEKEEQSLNETLEESIEAMETKAFEGKINISFSQEGEITFKHDRLWLEEAFINIIKNAIEHTAEGGQINIKLIESPVYRRVTIADNGEGIKEDELPNIFRRFYKGKNTKKNDSIGIGLALAKSIVDAHNGMIEVKSRVGVGTEFTITFHKY